MRRIAIVGFGLIGGSLALALRRSGGIHVTAIDRAPVLARAEAKHAADELLPLEEAEAMQQALEKADLTVLAVPVGTIVRLLPWSLSHARVVTDCGSTKREIAHAAGDHPRGASFVPGHPMAGLPDGGIENARGDLFEGRTWIVCPEHSELGARTAVMEMIRLTGAHVVELSPEVHDRAVAITSHLPQLIASGLYAMAEGENARLAMGPAFERATRGAGGLESMWSDIFETNADEVARAADALSQELAKVAAGLRQSPPDIHPALGVLARARGRRQTR
ncbi:MAG TPA: prephenate dehydrogenase/arogenate dehydrogenase family protein [Polyangiaceae bacterium]|nr:prephenate dehydrogenase/arogenate dehydrogenase family protein [Polyangiaceae bacterium]